MKYGYARISTIDQNADMQLKALERAGVEKKNIFKDYTAGGSKVVPVIRQRSGVRPELRQPLVDLRQQLRRT